jgi:hypothetical protein
MTWKKFHLFFVKLFFTLMGAEILSATVPLGKIGAPGAMSFVFVYSTFR